MNVLQPWVGILPLMQQTVLLTAIRGPDGLHKEHVAKYVLRWFRRSILLSAFEKEVLPYPWTEGGGSFAGKVEPTNPTYHEKSVLGLFSLREERDCIRYAQLTMHTVFREYLRSTDEVPHPFHMHFMHAAEILGYKHPVAWNRDLWRGFYEMCVIDAHLRPETEEVMDRRLGDVESQWREVE